MNKSKVENREVIELINGVINTYFIKTVLERPDMAKNAKDDLFEVVTNALNQQRLQIVEMVEIVKFNAKAPDDTLAMTPVERGMWYKAYYQACTDIINKIEFLTKLEK